MSGAGILEGLPDTAWSVAEAVLPLVGLFAVFQSLLLRLPGSYVASVLKGTALAAAGLLLFLQGVHVAFLPFGRAIGAALGALPHPWLLVPCGLLLGFLTSWGEPSVRILADQVEEASSGSIRRGHVLLAVSAGVALFVALGLGRIVWHLPLLAILVPGYAVAIAGAWLSDEEFLAIAVDAGGVATGPVANTFLLALALGVSSAMEEQDPVVHGLGLVSLIALAPIISVMALGFVFRGVRRRKERG